MKTHVTCCGLRCEIRSVNSGNSDSQSVNENTGSMKMREHLNLRDSIEIETRSQPSNSTSRVLLKSKSEKAFLSNCPRAHMSSSSQMHPSNDAALFDIVIRSIGNTNEFRASLQNFLCVSEKLPRDSR